MENTNLYDNFGSLLEDEISSLLGSDATVTVTVTDDINVASRAFGDPIDEFSDGIMWVVCILNTGSPEDPFRFFSSIYPDEIQDPGMVRSTAVIVTESMHDSTSCATAGA